MAEGPQPDRAGLAEAWERNARDWIAWARAPGHDSYWRFNRDLFLELVPPPGRRTLDLGCGEGRLCRDLAALGHAVVGVDRSPTLVAAAREADPSLEVYEADAAALPFADAAFDLVVAFMSLQDVDDLDGAVCESRRVLHDDGRFVVAIVHPLNSAGAFAERTASAPFVIESYLAERRYSLHVERGGYEVDFESAHRPLESYVRALRDAGFAIEDLREPVLPPAGRAGEHSARWERIPLFMYVRATPHAPRARRPR